MARLPPEVLVRTARWGWTMLWRQFMARLAPADAEGQFQRSESQFRSRIGSDTPFSAAANRYTLIVGRSCPWAHRTRLVHRLKGLDSVVGVIIVQPSDAGVWTFPAPFENCQTLPQLYQLAEAHYTGRSTVPLLWDSQTRRIVNNESSDIVAVLNHAFDAWASQADFDLAPPEQGAAIESWDQRLYPAVNNGVYRCGFAQTQAAYDTTVGELFTSLDDLEHHLGQQRFLMPGDRPSLADIRLFPTLIRFDSVYHGLFKCNRRRIRDYANLWGYLRDLYQWPGVSETCDLAAYPQDYYGQLFPLNPGGIVPIGPDPSDLLTPHGRAQRFPANPLAIQEVLP
jgi:glutathionyl-hydroquinone reductase